MAEILLDSDIIIAWLRGYDPFASSIPTLLDKGEILAWTPVSIAEIFAGVRKGEEARVENLFLVLEAVPLSAEIGRKAGGYLKTYSKSHGVELGDALIAATAYFNGFPPLDSQPKALSDERFPVLLAFVEHRHASKC